LIEFLVDVGLDWLDTFLRWMDNDNNKGPK